MEQQLLTFNQIKEMMDISSGRELSVDKVVHMANSILALSNQREKEIILARLAQFPAYAELNKQICAVIGEHATEAMKYNDTNVVRVHSLMDSQMDALKENLKTADTAEERREIRQEMSSLVDKGIEHDKENKRYLLNIFDGLCRILGGLSLAACAFAGVFLLGKSISGLTKRS